MCSKAFINEMQLTDSAVLRQIVRFGLSMLASIFGSKLCRHCRICMLFRSRHSCIEPYSHIWLVVDSLSMFKKRRRCVDRSVTSLRSIPRMLQPCAYCKEQSKAPSKSSRHLGIYSYLWPCCLYQTWTISTRLHVISLL